MHLYHRLLPLFLEGGGKAEPVILESLPAGGVILAKQAVAFPTEKGVCDVLRRSACETAYLLRYP